MMELKILQTGKYIRNIVGDGNLLAHCFRERALIPIVMLINLSILLSASFGGFMTNMYDDLIRALSSFAGFVALMIWETLYWNFLLNRKQFYLLLDDLEALIVQST